MDTSRRVVITGVGAITPIGNDVPSFWNALEEGVSGAREITAFDTTHYKTKFACSIEGFDPLDCLDQKEVNRIDRFAQLSIAASDAAIKDALIDTLPADTKSKIGVILGSGIGGLISFQQEIMNLTKNDMRPKMSPFFIPKMIVDIAPGLVSMRHGFMGANYSAVSACASSSHAIMDAVHFILLGRADIMLSGGSEAVICESGIGGFNAMRALSQRNDSPKTASRPYDKDRDGFVMGEGVAIFVLEELEHAKKRNANIYAEVGGCGASADAHHITAPHPEGVGACMAMKMAIESAGLSCEAIDYINTHGTSTPLGDIAEVCAIQSLFKEHVYSLSISSTKSMTGHLLGAAGAVELLACLLAVTKDIVPPTINHYTDDSDIDGSIDFTFNKAKKRTVRAALSNTFGFGGHNACILLKKYEDS